MAEDARRLYGVTVPALFGVSTPRAVAEVVVDAIRSNRPDALVGPRSARLMMGMIVLFPRLSEWLSNRLELHTPFRVIAEKRGQQRRIGPASDGVDQASPPTR